MSTTYADGPAVPGDPDALDLLARRCRSTAGGLRSDVDLLRGTHRPPGWSGRAADAYARSVHGLPRDLARAADSYDVVARALATYAAELLAVQARARRVEEELRHVDALLGAADAPPGRTAGLEQEQHALRCRLAALAADAELAASTAVCRVRSACDAPESPPGLLERLLDGAGDWVEQHAGVLADLSFVLQSISAIAGSLSFVPGLAAVAGPIAVAAGVAALVIDAALATRGRAAWVEVGVDAAVATIPGAGRLGRFAVREVRTRRGTVVAYRVEGRPNTRIAIDEDGDVSLTGRSMLYVNVGQRRRADDFLAQKVRGGLPDPQIKSFRIPKHELERLRRIAVEQTDGAARRASHRVDPTMAPDQFGLRRWDFRELEKSIVPGSGRIVR